ncbi:hypothetical protein HYW35_02785 [Candidatus Saccharibacteria bacterium]|nr:hypothetical protein [Candidatus Saccharibacteria bacterium]
MKTAKFWRVPYQVFLVLFIISGVVAIYTLRHNNQTMVKLREAVYAADKNGGDVNGALNSLRQYVYGHMNTNLSSGGNAIKPPIQLKYTYARLYDAERAKIDTANAQIYTDAQSYCQSVDQAFYGTTRVPCVQNYVSTHGVKSGPALVPAGLYQFDFISPSWSPDLAGWSLVVSGLAFAGFILSSIRQKLGRP